ncbi:MAG: TraM recognition domain-containing protein [Gammaproteobacteria bacterium]|nr:TraM recognition domain-containing protein [Gammaproteobacteria bacterium]
MIRGLDKSDEANPHYLLRDTRPLGKRFVDFIADPFNLLILMLSLGTGPLFFPEMADISGLCAVVLFLSTCRIKAKLPFRLPLRSKLKDYNDLTPGKDSQPRMAGGIYFFGNQLSTQEELWFTNDDMRTHVLIFGSTGSGKTESLISIAFNALIQGSGFIYIDGKGDNSLFAKIFSMVRRMGREDDMLLINFMTGARDVIGPQEKRLSNTMNPFSMGSSSMLSQLIVGLMPEGSNSGDGDMWKGRAIAFVEALMKVLVYARDRGYILLDANTIRNYFDLARLEAMVVDKQFIRDNQEPVSLADAPSIILEPISNYLSTLPGYDRSKKGKQVSQVLEQHGFITMQLTRVFGSLADTYGHIVRANLAEVDVKDVVLNRRILCVLLPALEKAPDELANLGKIIVASLKAMMAAGLGDEVEGTYSDVILRKPTNSPTPFLCIMDEYGYYAVKGFAVVPAQARSLGFSAIFAGQDLPAFQKASKEEAASIGANTNIKICMKLEDPAETWEFFQKTAGEAYVTKVDSFQTQTTSLTGAYMDTRSASSEKRARIDLMDLKEQTPGEAHIFFRSTIIRARMFRADPKPVDYMRLNQLLKVELPSMRQLITLNNGMVKFYETVEKGDAFEGVHAESEGITWLAKMLSDPMVADSIERGVNALLGFHTRSEEATQKIEEVSEPESLTELTIFTSMRLPQGVGELKIPKDRVESFTAPLLSKSQLRSQLAYVERLSGKADKQVGIIADELVKDAQLATYYPPHIAEPPSADIIAGIVNDLASSIQKAIGTASGA